MVFLKPPALAPQSHVRVVAPSGPFDRELFNAGLSVLQRRYEPDFGVDIFEKHRYLAGDDPRRLRELNEALRQPGVDAVFTARGGYGAMRLLEKLDFATLPSRIL